MIQIVPSASFARAVVAWTEEDFYAGLSTTPKVINTGVNADSLVLDWSGFDAFMGVLNFAGAGSTLTVSLLYLHPVTNAVIAIRQIATGVAPGAQLVTTWGAYNAALGNDVFGNVQVRLTPAGAAATINGLVIFGMIR